MSSIPEPLATKSPSEPWRRSFLRPPSTRLGWWAIGLAATFVALYIFSAAVLWQLEVRTPLALMLLPFYGIAMLLCGLAGSITGLIAVIRGERSWMVWPTMLPGLMVICLVTGEFLVPH